MVIIMRRSFRFNIISEGQVKGVSATCRKYDISRTLYYRWLKRYKTEGIEGLSDVKKSFVPVNKTKLEIENVLLDLFTTYPDYGPKAIKYLLDEMGYNVGESAVFNVMKRHNLTNKESRIELANNNSSNMTDFLPPFDELASGECWIFWITDYGYYENTGNIYEYTFYDYKSHIACSRLYNEISLGNFENLLTAFAMPLAQTLDLRIKFLCFFHDDKILKQLGRTFKSKVNNIISDNAYEFKVHTMPSFFENLPAIDTLRKQHTEGCLSFLMPFIHEERTFKELKMSFQDYVRDYNLNDKSIFDEEEYSPVQYHNKITNTKLILPIWAYINRDY